MMRFLVVAVALFASAVVAGQEQFQFVVAVSDAQGRPVTDLARSDIVMTEKGFPHEIVKVEPFRVPVKLTLAIDNGPLSADSLSHYRSGLTALVKTLPQDVEVTLITISPQPRMVFQPTTDRVRILRGINQFAPEQESPRFTDALVEFSQRLRKEVTETRRVDSLPVMVLVSTTAVEAVSYEVPAIRDALGFLQARKARVYVTMTSSNQGLGGNINANRQALIGIPATEITRGRYVALAISSRLTTLLPEFGREIAALHRKHTNQFLVSVVRNEQVTGPLQDPRIEVRRAGLTGQVSRDGLP